MTDGIETATAVQPSELFPDQLEYVERVSEPAPETAKRLKKPDTKKTIQNRVRQARYRARKLETNPTEFRAYKARKQSEYVRRTRPSTFLAAREPLTEEEMDRLRKQFRGDRVRLTAWLQTRQQAWRKRKDEIVRARIALIVYRASHAKDPTPARFAPFLAYALKLAISHSHAGRWLRLLHHLEDPAGPFFAAEPN